MSQSATTKGLTTKRVTAGAFATEYVEGGPLDAPGLLFLHDGGFGTTAELSWGPVMERLADEFRVVGPDMLGWGGTDKVVFLDRDPFSFRIQHLVSFCEAVDLRDFVGIGTCFGGGLLMRAASSHKALATWHIRATVSVGGTGGPFRTPENLRWAANYNPSLEEARTLTAFMVTDNDLTGLDDHIRRRHDNSLIPGHWEALSAPRLKNPGIERPPREDPYPAALSQADHPILLVSGTKDLQLDEGWEKQLGDLIPDCEILKLPSGHNPNIDMPDMLTNAILPWLRKQSS